MIEIQDLSARAGAFSLDGIHLSVPAGRYAVLMGKTGTGKTTLLECICGLRRVERGRILLQGAEVTRSKPAERGIGYVPQDGALFSTMSVREHLAFPLEIRRWPRASIGQRVDELVEWLGLRSLLNRRPPGLSGGEIQRVALGRALSFRPGILCLDEPLSALDEETREEMYRLLHSVREHSPVTTLHVSHSATDARQLADLVLILQEGRIREG